MIVEHLRFVRAFSKMPSGAGNAKASILKAAIVSWLVSVPEQKLRFELVNALYSTPKSILAATIVALSVVAIAYSLSGDYAYAWIFAGFLVVGIGRTGAIRLYRGCATRCRRRGGDRALGTTRTVWCVCVRLSCRLHWCVYRNRPSRRRPRAPRQFVRDGLHRRNIFAQRQPAADIDRSGLTDGFSFHDRAICARGPSPRRPRGLSSVFFISA